MENIVIIKGEVDYTITLDPGVWIFDDRKIDLNTYFRKPEVEKTNALDEYTKEISSHWDREITEGSILPPTIRTETKYKKEKMLTGTFGIPLKPFLLNASPTKKATQVSVITDKEHFIFDLSTGYEFVLGFSKDGKPLAENGPIHVYFGDGSNQSHPILDVREFLIT
jgi:hypothetical protein